MKLKIYHWYNALLSALLTMLGFGSCTELGSDEYGVPPVMEGALEYGTPYVEYIVRGDVTDEAGQPVSGIKAAIKDIYDENPAYAYGLDSVLTDDSGNFQMQVRSYMSHDLKLIVEDTDGPENGGEFMSDTLRLNDMKRSKLEDGKGWNEGKYELKAYIKLKRKP